jgi:hypothetical protein
VARRPEDDAGHYPVLGSVKLILYWLAFAGVPSIAAIAAIEWLRSPLERRAIDRSHSRRRMAAIASSGAIDRR